MNKYLGKSAKELYDLFHVPVRTEKFRLFHSVDIPLRVYCSKCSKRKLCDDTPPHPYDNPVWHSCEYKKRIAKEMMQSGKGFAYMGCNIDRIEHYKSVLRAVRRSYKHVEDMSGGLF